MLLGWDLCGGRRARCKRRNIMKEFENPLERILQVADPCSLSLSPGFKQQDQTFKLAKSILSA